MYSLLNVVEKAEQYPSTFEIPTPEDIADLEVGDFVKLIFQFENGQSERMWVKITSIHNDNFIGVLDSDPIVINYLQCGDIIEFNSANIADFIE